MADSCFSCRHVRFSKGTQGARGRSAGGLPAGGRAGRSAGAGEAAPPICGGGGELWLPQPSPPQDTPNIRDRRSKHAQLYSNWSTELHALPAISTARERRRCSGAVPHMFRQCIGARLPLIIGLLPAPWSPSAARQAKKAAPAGRVATISEGDEEASGASCSWKASCCALARQRLQCASRNRQH